MLRSERKPFSQDLSGEKCESGQKTLGWRTNLSSRTDSFGCRFSRPHDVTDNRRCPPTTAHRRRPPPGLSLPSLIMRPRPRRRRPPARLPRSAAGCPMAAKQPPAAQTREAPSMASPSCFRLDSQGRRSPSTPGTTRCRLSGSSSAPSWTRR